MQAVAISSRAGAAFILTYYTFFESLCQEEVFSPDASRAIRQGHFLLSRPIDSATIVGLWGNRISFGFLLVYRNANSLLFSDEAHEEVALHAAGCSICLCRRMGERGTVQLAENVRGDFLNR